MFRQFLFIFLAGLSWASSLASANAMLPNLEQSLARAERIHQASDGPRESIYEFYLETFRLEMLSLRSGPDRLKLNQELNDQIRFAALERRTVRSLARIASAYHFAFRLNAYLNFNSILVEKEPLAIRNDLVALDHEMGDLRRKLNEYWPGTRLTLHATFMRGLNHLLDGIEQNKELAGTEIKNDLTAWLLEMGTLGITTPRLNDIAIKSMQAGERYARLKRALRNVGLPDLGEVDGFDEAIANVVKIQIHFELVDHLLASDDWRRL